MIATTVLVVLLSFPQQPESRPAAFPFDASGTSLAIERLEAEVEALRESLEAVLPGGRPSSRPASADDVDLEALGVDPGRLRRIRALEVEVRRRRETLAAMRLRVEPDLSAAAALAASSGPRTPSGGTPEAPPDLRPSVRLPEVEATTALRAGDARAAAHAFEGRPIEGADPAAQYAVASALVAQGRIEEAIPIFRAIANRADRPLLQSAAERRLKTLEKKHPSAGKGGGR